MSTDYICGVCNKEYRLKYNYDRHVVCCEFLNKSRIEQHDELDLLEDKIPSVTELYRIIQDLSIRMNKLEKENSKLRQYNKKKMNILDWLSSAKSQPDLIFEDWFKTHVLTSVSKYLTTVFNNNLLIGLKTLFDGLIENSSGILPIRCFDNKANAFYVYEKNGEEHKWRLLSTNDFNVQLNRACHQFIIDFKNNWYLVNREKMETDETYKDMYINYYQKILGGDDKMTDEARFQKLRQHLYQSMKEHIKSVVEYDLE